MKKQKNCLLLSALALCCVGAGISSLQANKAAFAETEPSVTVPQTIAMHDGASIRLNDDKMYGLAFVSMVNYTQYTKTYSAYGDVKTGTIIVPTDYLTKNSVTEISHAMLNAKDISYYDVKNTGFMNAETAETDGYYAFRASLVNIKESNIARPYSAVSYVAYKANENDTDTELTYLYSAYAEENNSRSARAVATILYQDHRATETDVYKYKVEDNYYSKHSPEERAVLASYMAKENVEAPGQTFLKDKTEITLSDFASKFSGTSFTPSKIISATNKDGTSATIENGKITGAKDADLFTITTEGTVKNTEGNIVPAIGTAIVEIVTTENEYKFFTTGDMRSANLSNSNWNGVGVSEIGMANYNGAEVDVFKSKTQARNTYIVAKPHYSKAYYTSLTAKNESLAKATVSFAYYFDLTVDNKTTNDTKVYPSFTQQRYATKQWHTSNFTFAEAIASYDNFVEAYAWNIDSETTNDYTKYDVEKKKGIVLTSWVDDRAAQTTYVTEATIEPLDENAVFTAGSMQITSRYLSWEEDPNTSYGWFKIGERSVEAVKIVIGNKQSLLVTAKPVYTKDYYQNLWDSNATATKHYVQFSYYAETENSASTIGFLQTMNNGTKHTMPQNEWVDVKMPLREFIRVYDTFVTGYNTVVKNKTDKLDYKTADNGYLFTVETYQVGIQNIYMTDAKIVTEQVEENSVFMLEDMKGAGVSYYSTHALCTTEIGTYTLDGRKNVKAMKVSQSGATFLIIGAPTYTKAYYQTMLKNAGADASKLMVKFSYYIESTQDTDKGSHAALGGTEGNLVPDTVRNHWTDISVTLQWFVENYDLIATANDDLETFFAKCETDKDSKPEYAQKNYLVRGYIENVGVSAIYITPATIVTIY